jgi:hypothetical protein
MDVFYRGFERYVLGSKTPGLTKKRRKLPDNKTTSVRKISSVDK